MSSMNPFEKWWVNSRLWDAFTRRYVSKVLRAVPQFTGKILEIGCGKGTTSHILTHTFPNARITAVDVDPQQILLARQNAPACCQKRLLFVTAGAEALPFPEEQFDAVFEFNAFHHISQWRTAVAEAVRVLKRGGVFFAFDVGRFFTRSLHALFLSHELVHFSKRQFIGQLKSQGITITAAKGNDVAFWVTGRKSKALEKHGFLPENFPNVLGRMRKVPIEERLKRRGILS